MSRTPPSDKPSDPAAAPSAPPDTGIPPTASYPPGGVPAGGFPPHPGAEPVPGYPLVQLLGRGGFGEVWKATGPGGFSVALKFIPLGEQAGAVEQRALALMKDVRHANLLGLFGAWERDGFLVVAMELAERSLADRLREALRQGLPGIPAGELREYLREAAKGLDYLHSLGVQHRDVTAKELLNVGRTLPDMEG